MAFANIAGRAGFVLDVDKSQLDRELPEAERLGPRPTSLLRAYIIDEIARRETPGSLASGVLSDPECPAVVGVMPPPAHGSFGERLPG